MVWEDTKSSFGGTERFNPPHLTKAHKNKIKRPVDFTIPGGNRRLFSFPVVLSFIVLLLHLFTIPWRWIR